MEKRRWSRSKEGPRKSRRRERVTRKKGRKEKEREDEAEEEEEEEKEVVSSAHRGRLTVVSAAISLRLRARHRGLCT